MALADDPYPRPGSDAVQRYFTRNAGPARLGRFSGLLVSGIVGARLVRAAK